jgi:hypothetical protein
MFSTPTMDKLAQKIKYGIEIATLAPREKQPGATTHE